MTMHGGEQSSLRDSMQKHIKDEHETLAEKHNLLMKDMIAFLDVCEQGTKKVPKKSIRELRNRIAEEIGEPKESEVDDTTTT